MSSKRKIAVVTGGSRGLGNDMVFSLAKNGLDIVFTYNNQKEAADKVVKQIKDLGSQAIAMKLDVSDSSGFDVFVKNLKSEMQSHFDTDKFDFLINNAGFMIHGAYENVTEEEFVRMENVHFKGPFSLPRSYCLKSIILEVS